MKKTLLVTLTILFFSFSFAHDDNVSHYVDMSNPEGLVNPDGFFEYMIVKGDYLWMLADRFYGDPFKWSKIHKANPYIIDPDWIYPNNWLVIPNVFTDEFGKPTSSGTSIIAMKAVAIDIDGDGVIDGYDLDGDGKIDESANIDLDGDGVVDGYDLDGDGEIDAKSATALATVGATQIDLDGDGVVDGYDLDGDGKIDESANIDIDGDGIVDGYDLDGDGKIDAKSATALAAAHGIDLDGDGVIDGVDIDGDGNIDTDAELDIDGDGVVDGYDLDGDGKIDLKIGAVLATTGVAAAMADDDKKDKKSCVESYCGKPGWKLGLHAGYPLGSAPEDESLNLGLLLGTPLGVRFGPLTVGLGAGAFTYNFEDVYVGGGLLASLCLNDLLKLDIPLALQLHGAGFYVFGEESGPAFGGLASASLPLGKTPLSLGAYGGLGKYYPGDEDYNWANVGAVLFYNF